MKIRKIIDYLEENNVISEIFTHYHETSNNGYINLDEELITKIIKKSKNYSLNKFDKEIFDLGVFYKEEVPYSKRKQLGEIYTPPKIVEYILNNCEYLSYKNLNSKKLMDLSCGAGSFLISSIKRLIDYYMNKFRKIKISDFNVKEAQTIIENVKKNIIGADINPNACILAQINFHICLYPLYKILKEESSDIRPPIFNILNLNSLILLNSQENLIAEKFDFIVGNPPYLFIRDIPKKHKNLIESQNLNTNKGQYDYYQIFLELGIRYLIKGGKLGFILPDSLLALSNRNIIRKYIYENTKIQKISIVGSQFENSVVSNIILILEKELDRIQRENNIIKVVFYNSRTKESNGIEQKQLKKWNYRLLINLNKIDIQILDYLNNKFPKLEDLISNKDYKILLNRGVELTKRGKVFYCEKCKKYYPIPNKKNVCRVCGIAYNKNSIEKIIVENPPNHLDNSEFYPYIYTLQRYNIGEYKYINIKKKGINYKNLESFKDRIIIRQLNQDGLICASYDPNISLCSQSIYNLRILDSGVPEFNNLYLLALLNSNLLSYFFIKSFGSYKKLFPRILIEKINSLPIKIPQNKKENLMAREIEEKVKLILKNDHKQGKFLEEQQKIIDKKIFFLYGLEDKQKKYIEDFLKNG